MAYIKVNNYDLVLNNSISITEYNRILEVCNSLGYTLTRTIVTRHPASLYYPLDETSQSSISCVVAQSNGLALYNWFEIYYETHEDRDKLKYGYYLTVVDEIPDCYEKPLTKSKLTDEPLTDAQFDRKIQYLWTHIGSYSETINRCKKIMFNYTLTPEQTSRLQALIQDADNGLELEINKYCMQTSITTPVAKPKDSLTDAQFDRKIKRLLKSPDDIIDRCNDILSNYLLTPEQNDILEHLISDVDNGLSLEIFNYTILTPLGGPKTLLTDDTLSQALRAMVREPSKRMEFYRITLDYHTATDDQSYKLIEALNV